MDENKRVDREKYLSHIQDFEQIKHMNRILDMVEIVIRNYTIQTTDFLDPFIVKLAQSILNRFPEVAYTSFGGYDQAERNVLTIYPNYHYFTQEDAGLVALRLKGSMEGLSHRDFLGSILGTGIARGKLGDIILGPDYADLILKKEMRDYIYSSLERIGKNNFRLAQVGLEELSYIEEDFRLFSTSLSSLRLDVYISAAYKLSRKESQGLIQAGRLKLNYEPIDRVAMELKEGDLVSLRGYGRSRLARINGLSKKEKFRVDIKIYL